jgi:hypothetical protein
MLVRRDKTLTRLTGAKVLVPVDGETVRGTLTAVTPAWMTLTDCQAEDGTTIEGDLMVALPLPWLQVIR